MQINYDDQWNGLQIQHMSKVFDSPLPKYLAIGGALGVVYALVNYLANRKHSTKSTISLQETRTLIKEIKYQVYANCIPFAEGVDKKLRANYPAKDLDLFLRTELAKIYQSKEDLILQKRGVSKDQYKLALENHGKDEQIKRDQGQIFKVLEESIKGKIDLTVLPQAYKLYSDKQLLGIYRTMCEEIGVKVWEKLMECRRDHPGFDPKDDKHFRQAMRQLGIYEFKVKFLNAKGFKEEWGCSNFIFLKLFEGVKRDSPQIKAGAGLVEKGYQNIITKISADPDSYDRLHILRIMQDSILVVVPPANPPQQRVAPQPAPPPAPAVVRRPPPAQQKPKEDEFDMEKLMMEELLSRSQEEPKQEKVQRKLVVSMPVQPEVKVQAVPEVKVQVQAVLQVKVQAVPEVREEVVAAPAPAHQITIKEAPDSDSDQRVKVQQSNIVVQEKETTNVVEEKATEQIHVEPQPQPVHNEHQQQHHKVEQVPKQQQPHQQGTQQLHQQSHQQPKQHEQPRQQISAEQVPQPEEKVHEQKIEQN